MSWYEGLNPEQCLAVGHNHGPLLILAGAGSGKTTVLVSRSGRLIEDKIVRPDQLLVLTFTNKAARELQHRVTQKLGPIAKKMWAGTFHSFGMSLLRKHHEKMGLPQYFGLLDQSDSSSLIKELLKDIRIPGKDKFAMEELLKVINVMRSNPKANFAGVDEAYVTLGEVLLPKYLKKMHILGCTDFEGLLLEPLELLKKHPEVLSEVQNQFQQIMVDEFQDTNALQMQLLDLLSKEHKNISVVGDDDQSIYGWRGAQIENILGFPKKYKQCQVVKLERNYRCRPSILELANEVIAKNKSRHGKILKPEKKSSEYQPELFVCDSEEEELDLLVREINILKDQRMAFKEMAILFRANTQGGLIEGALRRANIPYKLTGGTALVDRKEVKDVLSYLKASFEPTEISLKRIINTPSRGIGDTSIEQLNEFAQDQKITFYQALKRWRESQVNASSGQAVEQFLNLLNSLPQRLLREGESSGAALLKVFHELGYRDYLQKQDQNSQATEKRWMFVEIFSRILDAFMAKGGRNEKSLREFIDAMDLRDVDQDEEVKDEVQLLTLHACKGLEFPSVFIVGIEEDLLPHKTLGGDVSEERRLFYVGITRAKERLIMTRCKQRQKYGALRPVTPSRFLLDIKPGLLKSYETAFRPVSGEQRQSLVSGFLSQLNKKIEKRDQ